MITPHYNITVESDTKPNELQPLNDWLKDKLVRMEVKKNSLQEADTLDIVISDVLNKIALPPTGARVSVEMGYRETGLQKMGTFHLDEIRLSGPPDQIAFSAATEQFAKDMANGQNRSFAYKSVEDIVKKVATDAGVKYFVATSLRDIKFDQVNQVSETDTSFLTRLAEKVAGKYVTDGVTYSIIEQDDQEMNDMGYPVETANVAAGDAQESNGGHGKDYVPKVSQWSLFKAERTNYDHVRAWVFNQQAAKYTEVYYPENVPKPSKDGKAPNKLVRIYTITNNFKDPDTAKRHAKKQFIDLKHHVNQIELVCPGHPKMIPGNRIQFTNGRVELTGDDKQTRHWTVFDVTHTLDARNGYTTRCKAWIPYFEG